MLKLGRAEQGSRSKWTVWKIETSTDVVREVSEQASYAGQGAKDLGEYGASWIRPYEDESR